MREGKDNYSFCEPLGIRVKNFQFFLLEEYESNISEDEGGKTPPSSIEKNRELEAKSRVKKNLLWINVKRGFFAQLLMRLNIYGSSDPRYQTMCTNGFSIQYHPDFVLSQNDAAVRFVLCHEILHCIGDHMSRRGNRDPLIWNYACDYAINPILNAEVESGSFEWPKNPDGTRMGLYEEKYEGMRAEDIYDLMMSDPSLIESIKSKESDAIHVIDADDDLAEPDSDDSIVREVDPGKGEGEGEGENEPGAGGGKPGEGKPGEGEGKPNLIGKKIRVTSGPNAGKTGIVREILPDGDIIIDVI